MTAIRAMVTGISLACLCGPVLAQTSDIVTPTETAETQDPQAQLLGGVAAVVNDEVISISDVAQRARLLLVTLGVQPTQENLQQLLPRALEDLIDERLQLQKAAEFDLEVSDADIDASIQDMARQNSTDIEGMYQVLRQSGINPETLREQMRAEIAWRRIMSGLYGSRIRISQLQISSLLDRIESDAGKTQYQLAEIFLFAPTEQDKQQVLEGANVIVQQLSQGARFELAAQQYSNSPTAAVGGDLGWVSPTELDPDVQEVLANTEPPALTSPIVVDDGVYIYAIRAKQDGQTGPKMVTLMQVLSPDNQRAALNAFKLAGHSCNDVEAAAAEEEGLVYASLGEVGEDVLTDQVAMAIRNVPEGSASDIIDTPAGPALLYVCDRVQSGFEMPSREQIEDRLFGQQIALQSQRELRDLKREATIIRR
ncbi:MAG: peptidylprolyl isomerase [Ponticaulis sp.]|nr:peptidylprolyl isomerase [Ponticaulis sp.]